MSKILDALEKSRRESGRPVPGPGPGQDGWAAAVVPLLPATRTVALDRTVLLRVGWVSALGTPTRESRAYTSLAEYLRSRVPPPARILVCGVSPGAGATSASLNLATEIALSDAATALWCELPSESARIRTHLGASCHLGLWDHLYREVRLRDVLLRMQVPRLALLPGRGHNTPGFSPPSPEDVDKTLTEIRDRYTDRYVVVDAPPPSTSRLTAALADRFDAAVLVVPAGTDRGALRRAEEYLRGCPLISVLLNRTPGCLVFS